MLDDLTLLTEVVNIRKIGAIEHLPDYMKICFKALYDMTNEIKSKWFKSGQLPRAEGYLKNNGIISWEVNVVMAHIVSLLGEGI
ncbi:hypothetical protein PS1_037209 [Malus domestica]